MLSVERVKQLLSDPSASDEYAEAVRDACRAMAEVSFQKWLAERSKNKRPEQQDGTPATDPL